MLFRSPRSAPNAGYVTLHKKYVHALCHSGNSRYAYKHLFPTPGELVWLPGVSRTYSSTLVATNIPVLYKCTLECTASALCTVRGMWQRDITLKYVHA